jgi:putative FmdB family regulatory protein
MPIYEYECRKCKHRFERKSDNKQWSRYILECPLCGYAANRIFSPPWIIQRGYDKSHPRFNRGKVKA